MSIVLRTTVLLIISNLFMTFAWYAHLRNLHDSKWFVAVVVSWGIAFFEYVFQVPANRIGYGTLTLGQLKVMQEVISRAIPSYANTRKETRKKLIAPIDATLYANRYCPSMHLALLSAFLSSFESDKAIKYLSQAIIVCPR